MKYYSETADKDLRLALEAEMFNWPKVAARKMFGCPCYQANGKLFALVVSSGIVITRPADSDREVLEKQFLAVPFKVEQSTGAKTMTVWLRVPALNRVEVNKLMPYLRKSYEAALAE
jgi:hypothetical protein